LKYNVFGKMIGLLLFPGILKSKHHILAWSTGICL
jgi:hypothetical protein